MNLSKYYIALLNAKGDTNEKATDFNKTGLSDSEKMAIVGFFVISNGNIC